MSKQKPQAQPQAPATNQPPLKVAEPVKQPVPVAAASPPKEPAGYSTKQELDNLQKKKQGLMDYQNKYFNELKGHQDPISKKLSERNAERVEDKILNAIRKGVLHLENSKQNYVEGHMLEKKVQGVQQEKDLLYSKLQNIDNELHTLKKQKINNPFSAYSQPTLKVYQQEEELQKQLEAQQQISRINEEQKTRRVKHDKQQTEQMNKLKAEEDRRNQEEDEKAQELKQQLQQKLREHINELKQKHENRLAEMDKMEEEYFTNLNAKMKQMAQERKHISNLAIPTDHIEPFTVKVQKGRMKKALGNSLTPDHKGKAVDLEKKIEIERPLHLRIKEEYEKRMKLEDDQILAKRKEQQDFHQKYSVDYEDFMKDYKARLKIKQKEYENKRQQFLETLGLKDGKFSQNVNASFDSKLWLLQESRVNKSLDDVSMIGKDIFNQGKEKRLKVIDYDKKVKEKVKLHRDEVLETEALVQRDKQLHPERYIKMVLKNDKERQDEKEIDYEIYKKFQEETEALEKERKEKEKEKYERDKQRIRKQMKNDVKKRDKSIIEEEELEERELPLATQKGLEYLKEFKLMDSKARELEKEEKKKQEEEDKKKKKKVELPVIDQSTKSLSHLVMGTLDRPDYLKEIKQKFNLEEKRLEQSDWQHLIEEPKQKTVKITNKAASNREFSLPSLQRPPSGDKLTDQQAKDKQDRKRRLHNKRVDKIKNKFKDEEHDSLYEETRIKKLSDFAQQMGDKAKQREEIVRAGWTTKPLKAVEQAAELDEMYMESIKAKLKVIELSKKK